MPSFTSVSLGGSGPGSPATLLSLVTTNGDANLTWWSLVISVDGNSLQLQCPACNSDSPCFIAPVSFKSGGWTLLTVGWTTTNSAMWWNDQIIATGTGIPAVSAEAASFTSLVAGSDAYGQTPATGLMDLLTTFSADAVSRKAPPTPFGLDPVRNLTAYGNSLAATTVLGPVSDASQMRMSAMALSAATTDNSLFPIFHTNSLPQPRVYRPTFTNGLQQVFSWPKLGTYWSLQKTNSPPYPFDPCPTCNVYVVDATNNIYLVDDLAYTYPVSTNSYEPQSPSPMDVTHYPDGTLYLTIAATNSGFVTVFLHNTTNGTSYTLQSTESLSGPNVTWLVEQDVIGTDDVTAVQVPLFGRRQLFFKAHIGPDSGSRVLFVQITGVAGDSVALNVYSTSAGGTYDIQAKQNLTDAEWVSQGTFSGLTNWTPTTVAMGSGSSLFVRARCWMDNGSGIPDWWSSLYGMNGLDPYALCPSGDGWTLYQAFQNGWNPWDWHTPPAPTGLTVKYYGASPNVIVQWRPSPGPATNYVICRFTTRPFGDGQTNYFSVAAGQTIVTNTLPSGMPDPYWPPAYQIMAQYPGGPSAWSPPVSIYSPGISLDVISGGGKESYSGEVGLGDAYFYDPSVTANAKVVRGSQGHFYLVTGYVPPGIAKLRLSVSANSFERSYPFSLEANYLWEDVQPFTNAPSASLEVSAAALTSGFYELPDWLMAWYGCYEIDIQAVALDGTASDCRPLAGAPVDMWRIPWGPAPVDAIPFLDGRRQIKENAEFQLRAAQGAFVSSSSPPSTNQMPFSIEQSRNSSSYTEAASVDYVTAGFHYFYSNLGVTDFHLGSGLVLDEFRPFEQNYFYANFLVAGPPWLTYTQDCSSGTCVPVGVPSPTYQPPYQVEQPSIQFSVNAFIRSGVTNAVADVLSPAAAQWIFLGAYGLANFGADWRTNLGAVVWADFPNLYGLKLQSVVSLPWIDLTAPLVTSYPGDEIPDGYLPSFYEVERPGLSNVDYYFARSPVAYTNGFDPSQWSYCSGLSLVDPRPGEPEFAPSAQTPLMILPFGQPFTISAWAKEAITNGFPNKFAYLEQYFENAVTTGADGTPTTNSAGLLSPYGEFFPMMPGPVALVTMPDIDTGKRGTGVVNVIKLQLDVNHDGNMDLSFGGPDNTSQTHPFTFWVNNDFDRLAKDSDDNVYYEDSVEEWVGPWWIKTQQTPDGYYRDKANNRVIPTMRDLEDFARLWVCGITTNLLASLPSGCTVTLDWGDAGNPNTNNPTIDLFQAADPDGGIGYLTNAATASVQTNAWVSWYAGQLGPGGRILLNDSFYTNAWAGNHFIWCGLQRGSGKLNLTIADAQSNVLAQTSAWIELRDIKEIYERRTVGEDLNIAPTNHAFLAQEDLPPGIPCFQYPAPTDTNTPYILFVHGWNLDRYMKDRFAETAFKRLYWQGYQGRFGTFRWPTDFNFRGALLQMLFDVNQKDNFDRSEYQAYKSAPGLLDLLTQLHATYGNNLFLYSVSHGNMVCGEALRLAGTNQQVNTYVASQAAVTAHTYDPTVPNYSFIYPGVCYSAKTPNIYGNWFAGNNGHAAGQIINFFNANDYALRRSVWQLNQLMKPDQLVAQSDRTWNYGYNGSTSDPEPWNNFYKHCTTNAVTITFDIVNTLTNRYEVMAFAAQSWTTALGATPEGASPGILANISLNVNLGDQANSIWPPDQGNYSAHLWHSGQFRGPYWQQQGYWRALLSQQNGFGLHNQ